MTATTQVPVTIQPEALAHAEKLGLRHVMEQMIERVKGIAVELRRIDVTLEHHPEDPTAEPQIVIEGVESMTARPTDEFRMLRQFDPWILATFQPEEWSHFVVHIYPGADDGR